MSDYSQSTYDEFAVDLRILDEIEAILGSEMSCSFSTAGEICNCRFKYQNFM